MAVLVLQSDTKIVDRIGGFTRLAVPEDCRKVGLRLTVFDRDYEFCRYEVTHVRSDGTVDTGHAIPWPRRAVEGTA